MFKSTKIAALFLGLILTGSTAVFAQAPQMPQQQQQTVEVSDNELTEFANAFKDIQVVTQEAQQAMSEVVQEKGMEVERFSEIHEASLNPQAEVEVTEEEQKLHEDITEELQNMQGKFQKKMEDAITKQGLSLERYEQIAMGVQADTKLQERLQALLQG